MRDLTDRIRCGSSHSQGTERSGRLRTVIERQTKNDITTKTSQSHIRINFSLKHSTFIVHFIYTEFQELRIPLYLNKKTKEIKDREHTHRQGDLF